MTTCPKCGYRTLSTRDAEFARRIGATRARCGVYRDDADALRGFADTYGSQVELAAAALAGWREAMDVTA